MSKRRKLLVNLILISILILLILVSTLLYINFYPRVSLHLISDDALYDTIQIKKNSSVPALKKPEKEGYVFVGWYTDQACTESFQYNEAISNDMELYAKYEAIDYSLTYNCYVAGILYSNIYLAQTQHIGDHVWTPDGSEEIVINGETTSLIDMKEGYTFMGWSTTPNSTSVLCSGGGDFLMPASNVSLYAMWEPNQYTVTYFIQDLSDNADIVVDAKGDIKYNDENQKLYSSQEYKYSYKMESPASPVNDKGYYTFVGWYLDKEFTLPINFDQVYMGLNQLSNSDLSPIYNIDNNAPIVLYAKWQVVEFDVLFCLNKDSRQGSIYQIVDSSIMVGDKNGSILNSDYFQAKTGYYYKIKMRLVDGGVYSNDLLDGNVYDASDTSVVSHKFLGWFTGKNGGVEYNDETIFNPEDFDRYYTNDDAGFEFLRKGVKTYVLYANWEQFYHIKYVYNGKTYDTQPVSANTSGKLRDVMSGIKRDGYYFDGWSLTKSASTVYDTSTYYRFVTDASMIADDTLYFGTTRQIVLYPHWSPNEYHIKYDFSINTLSNDKLVCIDANPQNIEFSDYLNNMRLQNPDPIVRYNYQDATGKWESHTVYNSLDSDGQSNAKYTKDGVVYLLCGWAVVGPDGKVYQYNDGKVLSASTATQDICKYSTKRNNKVDDGAYDFVIKALWKTQITVTFDKGYDDVEGDVPQTIYTITGNTITIPSTPNPTRPYHTFNGWVTAENRFTEDGLEEYSPKTRYVGRNTVSFGEDTTLYASWTPIVYTLNIYNTTTEGLRGSLLRQIKMTYADYSGNVGSVLLGNTIEFGDNATNISIPKGYSLDGFSLRAGGDVVLAVDTELTVYSKYLTGEGDDQTEQNLFDPAKSSSLSIYIKYSVKLYTVTVNVVDADGDSLEGFESIVVSDVAHGTLVGNTGGFVASNNIMAQISLPEGLTYDYWEISGVDGQIPDITKCYQSIESDMTITLHTKIQTFNVSLIIVDPIKNTVENTRTYNSIKYGTSLNEIEAIDLTIPEVFGFENGSWTLNEQEVETDEIVVTLSISLVTTYTQKQVNIIYHKSSDEDTTYTQNLSYNTSFTLPDQSIDEEFEQENEALSKWTLLDGTEVGVVGTSLTMTISGLMSQLGKTEAETKALFNENDGVLSIDFYAVYATLYHVGFADNDDTFSYSGKNNTVLSYVSGSKIDLISIVKKYITSIKTNVGYVYNNMWQIVDSEKQFDLTGTQEMYTITSDILLMPIVEKGTYPTKFYTVYADNNEGVLENGFEDVKVQLGDTLNLPSLSDVQSILSHNGVSYRALKWYLGKNSYELGSSITITSDILSNNSTLSFRLEVIQLRTFTYYSQVAGISKQTIVATTGDEITVGDIDGTLFDDFTSNTNYSSYISAWLIGERKYAYGEKLTITDSTPSGFYAVWTKKTVNVIYHQNTSADDQTVYEESHDYEELFQVLNQDKTGFEKTMYRITGWSTNADGTGDIYTFENQLKLRQVEDFHLYAVWTRVYKIIYQDSETGKNYTSSDLLYDGSTYTLVSASALSSVFTKEGHYIAKWKYAEQTFEPETEITVDDLDSPSGESIIFEIEWGADDLTVVIKYTDVHNNVYGTPIEISTSYGVTPEKNDDTKFDTTRQSILDNGIEYRFSCFVDQNGTKYYVGKDGYIEIGVVRKNLVLTTTYVKVLKLTYDLSSLGKENIVVEYGDGDTIGSRTNPLLTSADERIGNIDGYVLVGWKYGSQNYRISLNQTDSGYNYSKSWAESFKIKSNVTLTPVTTAKYTLIIWKDLTSEGEFDSNTKEEISLVEGDVVSREFDEDRYKGFVRQTSNYTYNPDASCSYQSSFSFALTTELANAYSSTKLLNLYPVKYVYITFTITEQKYEETFKYVAGEVISSLPDEVVAKSTDNDIVYFDSWIRSDNNSIVNFGDNNSSNKYYEDITIRAVYRNYYSIQYKLLNTITADKYNVYKIKRGETVSLLDESTSKSIYSQNGKQIIGFAVCYTENNIYGDHYKENGKTKVFNFGETITPSAFDSHYNLLIFPVYQSALITLNFGLGDTSDSAFTMQNAGQYIVESDSDYVITKSKSEDTITITFDHITDTTTRAKEEVVVSVVVDRSINNCSLTAFKFGDEKITISGKFKYTKSEMDVTFVYSLNSVNLNVVTTYNNTPCNVDYGYFTTDSDLDTKRCDETLTGDGKISVTLTAHELKTQTYIARFEGWFVDDTQITTTSGVFAVSGQNNEILTITNLTESTQVYAKFVSGYAYITQTNSFVDYRNNANVSFDNTLSAIYTNIVAIDDAEYDGKQISIDDDKTLAINPTSTITITYTLNTTENWRLWGVNIGGNVLQLGSDNKITYTVGTDNLDITMIVVPINVTVVFTGYDDATLGTDYVKTIAYNSTIDLDKIVIPDDVLNNDTNPEYTFVSWNYYNTPFTEDVTTITSNWEKLYKVDIVDTKDVDKTRTEYLVASIDNNDRVSTNGKYKNYVNLNSTDVTNFRLEGYNLAFVVVGDAYVEDYVKQSSSTVDILSTITKVKDTDLSRMAGGLSIGHYSDFVITTIYSRLFNIIDETSSNMLKTDLKNDTQFVLDDSTKEGHTFTGWKLSYVNALGSTIQTDVITFDNPKSLSEIFADFNDDSCPSSVIKASAIFEINTYTLNFVIPTDMLSYGKFVTTTTSYTLNWNTIISFETYENNVGGKANFVTSSGQSVEFELTTINGNRFLGFYSTIDSVLALSEFDFKSNTTIYCKFGTNPVYVEANLTYKVGSDTTDVIGGNIVVGGVSANGYKKYDYFTNDVFAFTLTTNAGFTLSSVVYSMGGAKNQTLSPDGNGVYKITLTANCTINVIYTANTTSANVKVLNNSGLNNTPFVNVSSPKSLTISTTDSIEFAQGTYLTQDTLGFKPNTSYYAISKICYKINGGSETEFVLDSARASNKYTYHVDDSGNYVVNYEFASNNIEIVIYLSVKKVAISVYNLNDSINSTFEVDYNTTLTYSDILSKTTNGYSNSQCYFKLVDGSMVYTLNSNDAIGAYHFGNAFTCNNNTIDSENNIHITDNANIYPVKAKSYILLVSGDESKYTTGSLSSIIAHSDKVSFTSLKSIINPISGYQFDGFNVYVGYNNAPSSVGSTLACVFDYDGTNWSHNGNTFTEIEIDQIDSDFANSFAYTDHYIYLEPIMNVVKNSVTFSYEGLKGADGSMSIKNADNVEISYTGSAYNIILEYFDVVVRTSQNVLQVYSSTNTLKYTVTFTPDNACKLGTIMYGENALDYPINVNDRIQTTNSYEFRATFLNGDASVKLKFNVDKNITNLSALKLTITGASDFKVVIDGTTKNLSTINKESFAQSFEVEVSGTRGDSFTYAIDLENGYTCDGVTSGTITLTSSNNNTTVVTLHVKLTPSTIEVGKSADTGVNIGKCLAVLYYKQPVMSNGVVVGYTDANIDLQSTKQNVSIYLGDSPYIVSTSCHDAYEIDGVYDVDNNTAATKQDTNSYTLDTNYSTFYIKYKIKTVSLSFSIKDVNNNYNISTYKFDTFTKNFAVTDIVGLINYANSLNEIVDGGYTFDLNQYIVLNTFTLKLNYQNIMLVKNSYTLAYNSTQYQVKSYWDIESAIVEKDGITYIEKGDIQVYITSAKQVAITVENSKQGYFTFSDNTDNKNVNYVLFSSTASSGNLNQAIYKVVTGKSVSVLPTITPVSINSKIYSFVGFKNSSTNYPKWSDINLVITEETVVWLTFKEITYNITVSIQGLSGVDGTITQNITFTLLATNTFESVLSKVFDELSRRQNYDDAIWEQSEKEIYVFRNCLDMPNYYYASSSSLYDDTGININIGDDIYTAVSYSTLLLFKFETISKVGLSINANDSLVQSLNLSVDNGKFVLNFSGVGTYFNAYSGTTLYVVSDSTIDLSKLRVEYANGDLPWSDICKYNVLGSESLYTFSHFKDNSNQYMTVFNYNSSTGERSLCNNDGTPTNTTITLSTNTTLDVEIVSVYNITVTLTTRNSSNDAILTNKGVENWSNNDVLHVAQVFAGKKIKASDFASHVSAKVLDSNGLIAETSAGKIYVMAGSAGASSDTEIINGYIVSGSMTVYGLVYIRYTKSSISVYSDAIYQGNTSYSSSPYSATVEYLANDTYYIFEDNSSVSYSSNTLPYIIVNGKWVINSALSAAEQAKWTIDNNHQFVGYLCTLNGTDIVIGTSAGNYVDTNNKSYTIKAFNELSTSEKTKLNSITKLYAVYRAGASSTVSRNITTYTQGANSTTWTKSVENKYTVGFNNHGYAITVSYTDMDGIAHTNEAVTDGGTIEKIRFGTTVLVYIKLAGWYGVDSANYKTVSGSTYTFEFKNFSTSTNLSLPINAYYYDLSLPSASGWTLANSSQNLFNGQTSTNWTFPKSATYTIENGAASNVLSTTFTMKVVDHNGTQSVSAITATHSNQTYIAVVEDGIGGTTLTTFHSGVGGVKSVSGTIENIKSSTILKLSSYQAFYADAVIKMGGSEIKAYEKYVMYYYSADKGILYWNKLISFGTPQGVSNGKCTSITGSKTANEIITELINKINSDTDISDQISGKTPTITWNGVSSTTGSGFAFSIAGEKSVPITINYGHNASQYTFTINKSSDTPENIGFVSGDILSGTNYTTTYANGGFTYVSGVTVNNNSIVITGNRYADGAVSFTVGGDGLGNYIAIAFYSSSTVSGSPEYTAKVYYNSSSAASLDLINSTMSGSASSASASIGIVASTYTLALTDMSTGQSYSGDDYKITIRYRSDISETTLSALSSALIWYEDVVDDILNKNIYTSPLNKANSTMINGVDYINISSFVQRLKNLNVNNKCWYDVSYKNTLNNMEKYGLNNYSTSTWYRLRGITTTAGYNVASSYDVRTIDYVNSALTEKYMSDATWKTTFLGYKTITHYFTFDKYEKSAYTYDLNIDGTYDSNLTDYGYTKEGTITWTSEYNNLSTQNFDNMIVRSFGGTPSTKMVANLKLVGTFATYSCASTYSVDSTNCVFKLQWAQIEYTVGLYGKEGSEGTGDDIIAAIQSGITTNFQWKRLKLGETLSLADWMSEWTSTNARYDRSLYTLAYCSSSNPANSANLYYYSDISASSTTVSGGLLLRYPLYIPQAPYSVGLYTYGTTSSTYNTLTGYNYAEAEEGTAFYNYFRSRDFSTLIIPEWNFTSSTSIAYKVTTIDFVDKEGKDVHDFFKVGMMPDIYYYPSDIESVYIGKNITKITSLDYTNTSLNSAGFYGSYDGIMGASSITKLTWSPYTRSSLQSYIVDENNKYFASTGNVETTTWGYLVDKDGEHLYHYPASLPGLPFDFEDIKIIDPFAFAYVSDVNSSSIFKTITLPSVQYIGSCAWYGADSNFATTIEITSADLKYVGYQLIDARNCDIDIWFYNNIPFIDSYGEGIYTYNELSHGLHGTALLATYGSTWTSGFITVHYQPDYDANYMTNGLRDTAGASTHCLYLETVSFTSNQEQNGRMIFKMIEADAEAFVVSSGIIQGINKDKLSRLQGKKYILLPTSGGIKGVNYLGQVDSSGNKLTSVSTTLTGIQVLLIPASYTSVGSILNIHISTYKTYSKPGVNINEVSVGIGNYNWSSIGDGTWGAFIGASFGVTKINLPNVATINNVAGCSTYNSKIKTIILKSTGGVIIGKYGLAGLTGLTTLEGTILWLDNYALFKCQSLTSIDYATYMGAKGLSFVAENMAYGSGLTSIWLNSSAEYMLDGAAVTISNIYRIFEGMEALTEVRIDGKVTSGFTTGHLWTRDGILYGFGTGKYDSYLLHVPRALDLTDNTIEMCGDSHNWGADKIAQYALEENISESVEFYIMAGDLESIGERAFQHSKIKSIKFSSYVAGSDSDYFLAFENASNLASITIAGGAEGTKNYVSKDGCIWSLSYTYLYYVPENWGVDNSDGGETFTIDVTSSTKIGAAKSSGQRAFDDNKNVKYIVINDTNHVFDETLSNFVYHTSSMKNFESVSINGALVYLNFDIQTIETSATFNGILDNNCIWTDGTNTYYSGGSDDQFVWIDGDWVSKTWTGLTDFEGNNIWTDGENIYYSSDDKQYVLNGDKWEEKTWTAPNTLYGQSIWTDGENIYYSSDDKQYVLYTSSGWYKKTWTGLTSFYSYDIWTDGNNIYYSNKEKQYVLNKTTSTWSTKTWTGLTSFYGEYIWTDGTYVYYNNEYILEPGSSYWRKVTYKSSFTVGSWYYECAWTDGDYIYFGHETTYRVRPTRTSSNFVSHMTWKEKTFEGSSSFDGSFIWTDGTDTYYSNGSYQYVLNKTTNKWDTKTWAGSLKPTDGRYIWTDGTDTYYSFGSTQYVLSGSTWSTKTWTGLTSFDGDKVWKRGTVYYYSSGASQYILSNSTWSSITWTTSLKPNNGSCVWTDGTYTYYSFGSIQYVLSGSTWSTKTWTGLTSFRGYYIWTDGVNTYYSDDAKQYILKNGKWVEKTWLGSHQPTDGQYIWTDGEDIYYLSGQNSYKLSLTTANTCRLVMY